jgi:hypothetical protein
VLAQLKAAIELKGILATRDSLIGQFTGKQGSNAN